MLVIYDRFLMLHFNTLLYLQRGVFPLDFPSNILHALLLSLICATRPTCLFLLYLIALILFSQQQKIIMLLIMYFSPPSS